MASDLESTIKEKVTPLLEGTMEKSWGITIPCIGSDISDKLRNPLLHVYVPQTTTFHAAKKRFKAAFLKTELHRHLGNVSQLAKLLGVDRRSVHRAIRELDIDMQLVRHHLKNDQERIVDQTIRSTLGQYRSFIQPEQLEKFYLHIPELSRSIAQILPHQDLTWKQAEREFERQLLSHAVESREGDIPSTAKQLQIRVETLYRKLKKLGIR